MLDNLELFFKNIFLFLFLLLVITLSFYLIKLLIKNKYPNHIFLKFNIIKILFLFSFTYLIVFIMYSHKSRKCEELVNTAKCQCYALKLSEEKDMLEKSIIAKEAQKFCNESNFFKIWTQ